MRSKTASYPRLLDLTRLVRRAARPMTGVDRVEYAYLDYLTMDGPVFGLVRSSFGYVLLDRAGCLFLRDRILDQKWGPADRLSRLKKGLDPARAGAEAALRRIAIDRCLPQRLSRMLRQQFPDGVCYINVGHSNFTNRVISALNRCDAKIVVLVHDTIPLDFPQFQRKGTGKTFAAFLRRVEQQADLVICNSNHTQTSVLQHMERTVPTVVAPLGVPVPRVESAPDGPWSTPYFVALGTIEPRKNHALLLDLWREVPNADLVIIGARGWENHAVFAQLEARPARVHELGPLSDASSFALLKNAAGLLFPSFAEGYGLPPIEAAALGTPVVCNDLPVYREILGDIPVYENVTNKYEWLAHIQDLVVTHETLQPQNHGMAFTPPSWDAHFKSVLTLF